MTAPVPAKYPDTGQLRLQLGNPAKTVVKVEKKWILWSPTVGPYPAVGPFTSKHKIAEEDGS